jgi:glyoxylase-like metal-dependent hydrolase (beta-lactamase superfamily II)
MKAVVTGLTAAFALAGSSIAAPAPAGPAPAPFSATGPVAITTPTAAIAGMQIKQVTKNVYMVVGQGGNSTVHVSLDGVILVDTKNAGTAIYNDLIGRIRWATVKPVRTVVVTHQHGDHSGNIGLFTAQNIPVITHSGLLQGQQRTNVPASNWPNKTYDGGRYPIIGTGGHIEAIAYHFTPGHTGGDTVVYFPDDKVVSVGDMLTSGTPNVDSPQGGTAKGIRDSIGEVLKLDFDWAIPGHGDNPMTKAEVQAYKQKWDTFISRGQAAVKSGVTKDKLMASIKTDDLGWNVNTPIWNNPQRIDALYAEFSQ